MLKIGRYDITNDFKVKNIISEKNPQGDGIYDPYELKEVLPFWGTLVTTFWGLSTVNREYLINTTSKDELEMLNFEKFWIFWFCNGDLNDQIELFFTGQTAKEQANSVLQVFNHLQEVQVDNLIRKTKEEFINNKE